MTSQENAEKKLFIQQEPQKSLSRSSDDFSQFDCFAKSEVDEQLHQLRQKAHKSFLQVMQMQNLHQQEINVLRQEYQLREEQAKNRQELLSERISILQNQIKLSHHNSLEIWDCSFSLDGIDTIQSKDVDTSKFDQSSILQIKELAKQKDRTEEDKLRVFRKQILKDIRGELTPNTQQENKITKSLDKIFRVIAQLTDQNLSLKEQILQLKNQNHSLQSQYKNIKIQYGSAQKQSRFLSDHIKRISTEKFTLQKQVSQQIKAKRQLQQIVKHLKLESNQQLVQSQSSPFLLESENKSCLGIDTSIQSVEMASQFNLDKELNAIRIPRKEDIKNMRKSMVVGTIAAGSPRLYRVSTQHDTIKNFRKNKESSGTGKINKVESAKK